MLALAKTVDGWKAHLLGAAIMVVGVAEMFGLDLVPDVDGSNAFSTVAMGAGLMAGRSAMKKMEGKE